jgi:hypothetical protein
MYKQIYMYAGVYFTILILFLHVIFLFEVGHIASSGAHAHLSIPLRGFIPIAWHVDCTVQLLACSMHQMSRGPSSIQVEQ